MSRRTSISGTCSNLNAIAARLPATRALSRAGWALALLAALFLAAGAALAAISFPALTGRVVDQAELLSPAQEAELTQKSEALQRAAGRQLIVATVTSLQDNPIEDYGYQLGRHWQLGQSEANNGMILLVAPSARKVRIEVGYGLEPIMTDALAHQIIQQQILPRFRENDYAGGISAGADAIIAQLQAPPEQAEQRALEASRARQDRSSNDGGSIFPLIFWIVILFFIIIPMLRSGLGGRRYSGRRRRGLPIVIWGPGMGGGWGGGSSSSWGGSSWGGGGGGGFGGFSGGGGSFGGGGASGGW